MRLLIDGDGCPVVARAARLARERGMPCLIFTDINHEVRDDYAQVVTVDQGPDSVDYAILNRMAPGDIVVTQDWGLASLVLAKGGRALDQNGRVFTPEKMDDLLEIRYQGQRLRRAGGRTRGPAKRQKESDHAFDRALTGIMEERHATDF